MTRPKKTFLAFAALLTCGGAALVGIAMCGPQGPGSGGGGGSGAGGETPPELFPVRGNLVAFASDAELTGHLKKAGADYQEWLRSREQRSRRGAGGETEADMAAPTASAPAEASAQPSAEPSGSGAEESVTNTQEAGVDEGGIVKVHGEHLVVLRRGRLFTIRIDDEQLAPVSMVDVFPPGTQPDAWYDEMLISGNTIVVIGYSYQASGTEIGLFDIDAAGTVRHRDTYYLRSNDYYSSRNYASRLIGSRLIFYMPYFLFQQSWGNDGPVVNVSMPAFRRFRPGRGQGDDWNEIVRGSRVFRPVQPSTNPVLHTVVTCDLSRPQLACDATGVIGPYGRNFYVSSRAVYVWVSEGYMEESFGAGPGDEPVTERAPTSAVYRLPLGDGAPGAVRVWGAPVDQFSFKESDDGHLNVLVRSEGGGDWMWHPEGSEGDVALARMPLSLFGTAEVQTADRSTYTSLARPARGYSFQNRFVGDYVLYGTGNSWDYYTDDYDRRVFLHPWSRRGETLKIELPHGVDRIEALGNDAVVIGTDGRNLHFSAVRLGDSPRLADRLTQPNATQGETRSHGFFYRPTSEAGGTLGLPIRGGGIPGWVQLRDDSAGILYLRVDDLRFERLGALVARTGEVDDRCVASCVDWYGNARPLFLRNRIFALLGYEMVEGRIEGNAITEVRRINFFSDRGRLR